VEKLYNSISRNTTRDFKFTCFTDKWADIKAPIEFRNLPINTGDWFNKIALYNQDLFHVDDQIFYFDLDTVIVGDLDEIFEFTGDFILLRDFYRRDGFGSGLMSWKPDSVHYMWKRFKPARRIS
jgi:hypothetical protein